MKMTKLTGREYVEVNIAIGFMGLSDKRSYVIEKDLYNNFKTFVEGLSKKTYTTFMHGKEDSVIETPAKWVNTLLLLSAVYKKNVRQFKASVLKELERMSIGDLPVEKKAELKVVEVIKFTGVDKTEVIK